MKKFLLTLVPIVMTFAAAAQNGAYTPIHLDAPVMKKDLKKETKKEAKKAPAKAAETTTAAATEATTSDTTAVKRWQRAGLAALNLSQVSLSNWSAGGEGLMAFDAMFNYEVIYTRNRHVWDSRLELAYGLSSSSLRGVRKTNDKIYLTSMYGYSLSRTWYLSLLGIFSSQFANGFDYTTRPKTYMSRFMAPGYLNLGIGFTWKPKVWLDAYFSPATWRGTFVFDDRLFKDNKGDMVYEVYGVMPGRHVRHEFGANVRLEANCDIVKGLHLYSRLDLFSNYLHKPHMIDVRWYVLLTAKINRWLAASLALNMLYDDNIRFMSPDGTVERCSRFQVKEVLGIGLQTTF